MGFVCEPRCKKGLGLGGFLELAGIWNTIGVVGMIDEFQGLGVSTLRGVEHELLINQRFSIGQEMKRGLLVTPFPKVGTL